MTNFLKRAENGNVDVLDTGNHVLEIFVHSWVKVSYSVFRSFTGKRRLDGKPYHGKRFYYLSHELVA